MPKKQVVVEIDEEGNCSIDGQGFVGPECQKFIGEIESDLGVRTSTTQKAEFRQRTAIRQRERN